MIRIEKIPEEKYFVKISNDKGYDQCFISAIRALPGREYDYEKKRWTIPITFLKDSLDFLKDLDNIKLDKSILETRTNIREEKEKLLEIKNKNIKFDGSTIFNEKYNLYKYQQHGVGYLCIAKKVLLGDDVGLGKTIQSIGAFLYLYKKKKVNKTIIFCPSSVKYQWKEEILKYVNDELKDDFKDSIVIIDGGRKNREKIYSNQNYKIFIINYEISFRDLDVLPKVDCIILDEATKIKSINSKTSHAIKKFGSNIKYKYALTATSLENKLEDLFSIIDFLEPGLLGNIYAFRLKFCELKRIPIKRNIEKNRILEAKFRKREIKRFRKLPESFEEICGYTNIKRFNNITNHILLRRILEDTDLTEIPEIVINDRYIELSKKQREVYNDFKNDIIKNFEKIKKSKFTQLSKVTYFREICDSLELLKDKTKDDEYKFIDGKMPKIIECSYKLKELLDLLNTEYYNKKVIVFTQFAEMAKIIKRECDNLFSNEIDTRLIIGDVDLKDREITKDLFNNIESKTKILVMTDAGKFGLNLHEGQCNYLINFEIPWNPSVLKQRIGRIRRIGQKNKKIFITNFISSNTIEDKVYNKVLKKLELFKIFVDRDGDIEHWSIDDNPIDILKNML